MLHGRPRQGSFVTIITAVMVATLIGMQQSANGQTATHYVCANACPGFPQPSPDLWDVMENSLPDDVIWVAQGIYRPICSAGIECSFELKEGVSVYGSFIGSETDLDEREPLIPANASILDGILDPEAQIPPKALHVVRVDRVLSSSRSYIDGFTIRNGHARGHVDCSEFAPPPNANAGGGMLVTGVGSELAVVMCRFEQNIAGADMCPSGFCISELELGFFCDLNVHSFRGLGGAMALVASSSTGIDKLMRIQNCVFENNRAATGDFGGSDPAGPVGGALYKSADFGKLEIMNSLFVGNVVDARVMPCCPDGENSWVFPNDEWGARGGALSFGDAMVCATGFSTATQTRLWNCTIYGNELRSAGAATARLGRGIWSDKASGYTPPASPEEPNLGHALDGTGLTIVNTIVHGNLAFRLFPEDPPESDALGINQIEYAIGSSCSSPYVAFSNVEGSWPGFGNDNIDSDPEFVNASAGNFLLTAGSPCIDSGTDLNIPLDEFDIARTGDTNLPVPDLDHGLRVVNCAVDMGAFERQSPPGDLNDDGKVDFEDLLILLAGWGSCPGAPDPCPGDLNDDGAINFSDLSLLLSYWSWMCVESEAQMGSIEQCITRLGLSNPEALAACIEAMIMNGTP